MNKLKRSIFLLLAGLLFLLPQVGECYVTLRYKDVPAGYYNIRLPYDTYIIEYELGEFKNGLEGNPWNVSVIKSPVNFYQFVISDGSDYRSAWVLFATSEKDELPDVQIYFKDLDDEKKAKLLLGQQMARQEVQRTLEERAPLNSDFNIIRKVDFLSYSIDYKFEVLSFEWPDVQFPFINGKHAMTNEARIAVNFNGVFGAMYAKAYAMEIDGKLHLTAFLCLDSEKAFWQGIMDKAVITTRK